jgi:hypothetical protein
MWTDTLVPPLTRKGVESTSLEFLTHKDSKVSRFLSEKYVKTYFPDMDMDTAIADLGEEARKLDMDIDFEIINLENLLEDVVAKQLFFFFFDQPFTIGSNSHFYESFVNSLVLD